MAGVVVDSEFSLLRQISLLWWKVLLVLLPVLLPELPSLLKLLKLVRSASI
jgi:hypothetical protein